MVSFNSSYFFWRSIDRDQLWLLSLFASSRPVCEPYLYISELLEYIVFLALIFLFYCSCFQLVTISALFHMIGMFFLLGSTSWCFDPNEFQSLHPGVLQLVPNLFQNLSLPSLIHSTVYPSKCVSFKYSRAYALIAAKVYALSPYVLQGLRTSLL